MEAIDRLISGFTRSTVLMKIVWINIGIFVALRLAAIVCVFSGHSGYINVILAQTVELPSQPAVFLTRPWTLITYMFAQYDLWHIVFNMLWLYWFGTMFRMMATSRQLLVLYLYGGLAGAALFLLGYNTLPLFHNAYGSLIGSSAAVIAIVTAVAILMPDFKMHLLLIGGVSVKWIAVATIALVLIGVTGSNAGGEIAHVGGVLTGALFAVRLRRGHDITAPACSAWDKAAAGISSLTARRSKNSQGNYNATYRGTDASATGGLTPEERRELDAILDKIKKSGYTALTPAERDRLFNVSRKIK